MTQENANENVEEKVALPGKEDSKRVILNLIKPDNLVPVVTTHELRSLKGQFGWITLGEQHVPYIFRGESSRYVSLRIVNQNVFSPFFKCFRQELFDIFLMKCYTMTDIERRLYNDINGFHCNHAYGLNAFQKGEKMMTVSDVIELYEFLSILFARLIKKRKDQNQRYGFMTFHLNHVVPVPFVKLNDEACFPINYFEGDDSFLQNKSKPVSSFCNSTFKVLMKIQGVAFPTDGVRVITLNDIGKYFERDNVFLDTWLQTESQIFLRNATLNGASILRVVNADGESGFIMNAITGMPALQFIRSFENISVTDYPQNNTVNIVQNQSASSASAQISQTQLKTSQTLVKAPMNQFYLAANVPGRKKAGP